jgi:hypothetical protein
VQYDVASCTEHREITSRSRQFGLEAEERFTARANQLSHAGNKMLARSPHHEGTLFCYFYIAKTASLFTYIVHQ